MIENNAVRILHILLYAALAGCAGMPVDSGQSLSESEYRDSSLDVMFATEFPVASADEALARATSAYRAGELDEALFFYVRALQFTPDDVQLLARIGDIHLSRKDFARAKRAYAEGRSIDPNHAESLEALGLIYMMQGDEEAAVAELTTATVIDESRWRAQNALGVYLDKSGDFGAAQARYDLALRYTPDSGQVLNNRGYSKYLSGDFGGAVSDLTAAAEKDFKPAWGNLGHVYASKSMYDEAMSAYMEIMGEAKTFSIVGQIAMDNGHSEIARHYLEEAVRLSPTYFPEAEKKLQRLQAMQTGP